MKYYVVSDVHDHYRLLKDLLNKLKVSFDSKQFPMKKKYDDVTK